MFSRRQRLFLGATLAMLGIWIAAWGGHTLLDRLKMNADKVGAFVDSVDLDKLSGAARARALQELEDDLNRLSYEERQRLRAGHLLRDWFAKMTEAEKAQFLAATMPAGFQQMIGAYEGLTAEKRRRLMDDSLKNLKKGSQSNPAANSTNEPPAISPELEAEIRTIGLKSFYSQSSAETKAEVAPLLEEMQRQMESGRMFRHP
jgi:hypothetical protein